MMRKTFLMLLILTIACGFVLSVGGCAKKKVTSEGEMETAVEEKAPQPGEPGLSGLIAVAYFRPTPPPARARPAGCSRASGRATSSRPGVGTRGIAAPCRSPGGRGRPPGARG